MKNATVVLLDYPRLFPASDQERGCGALSLYSGSEQDWLNSAAATLDATMKASAARMGVHYVSQLDAWAGHEICGRSGEWVMGPTMPDGNDPAGLPTDGGGGSVVRSGSFHPNQEGQRLGYGLNAFLQDAAETCQRRNWTASQPGSSGQFIGDPRLDPGRAARRARLALDPNRPMTPPPLASDRERSERKARTASQARTSRSAHL